MQRRSGEKERRGYSLRGRRSRERVLSRESMAKMRRTSSYDLLAGAWGTVNVINVNSGSSSKMDYEESKCMWVSKK